MIFFPAQSFKGTIEAIDVCRIAKEILNDNYNIVPISDGGDGFLNVIEKIYINGKREFIKTFNANNNPILTEVYKYKNNYFIESANIIGLKRIRKNSDVFNRTSRGIGILFNKIYNKKNKYYIGLGGSATIDIGGSMLESLKYETVFHKNTRILKSVRIEKQYNNIFIIPDVKNPLNTNRGAIEYAYQKGLDYRKKGILLKMYNEFAKRYNIEYMKYMGASGGLVAAFYLIGAKIIDNFIFFDSILNIEKNIKKYDTIVLTEGIFDKQSFYGKINGKIVNIAHKYKKRIIVITGKTKIKDNRIEFIIMNKDAINKPKYYFRKALKELRIKVKS